MNIKVQLAELCANRKLPMPEYKKLTAFTILEQESNIIEKIECFHLPEITKLICGSEILVALPWACKYKNISALYCNPNETETIKVILGCKTASLFESEILQFADASILQKLKKHFDDLYALHNEKRKERTELVKKINAKKKKEKLIVYTGEITKKTEANPAFENEENIDTSVTLKVKLSDDENKLELLKSELSKIDAYLKQHKAYVEKISAYVEMVKETDSDENREKAYRCLYDMMISHEENFLNNFISSGVVSAEYHVQFRDQDFVNRILQCLEKGSFKNYSLPILLKLYDEGAIDLIEGPANDFLNRHPERICDYLMEKAPLSIEDLNNPEVKLLIEKAIQKELSYATEKNKSFFSGFWNTIIDKHIWRWVVSKANEFVNGENINLYISRLFIQLEGMAAKSLIEVLFNDKESIIKVSIIEVVDFLLKNRGSCERDVIIEMIRLLEQNKRKIQRKLNTSERKLRSRGQELFTSIYFPMEQLEELAIDLKLTKGEIKAGLVATHIIDIVLSLREGFEVLDLLPVADTDDWKNQNEIEFNPNAHCITIDNDRAFDTVKLRSLGFRYKDDDGKWQQYRAQASAEFDLLGSEKKIRKGYPKYEQPGQKKSGLPVHCTISKKRKKGKKH